MPAFERESDYELAAEAFPASLKTMEGLLQAAPDNRDLLLLLAKGYAAYALLVLEDRLELVPDLTPRFEHLRQRVRATYLRAHRYGLRLLDLRVSGFRGALGKDIRVLQQLLARCDKQDVPALLWTGLAMASALNVARDDIGLLAKAAHVRLIMERILALDQRYYFGGAHLVLGAMQGSSGALTGGNAELSKKHFERALVISKRGFLLIQERYAKTLAVQQQDRALYQSLLEEILAADLAKNPNQKLANVAAKRRARRALARIDELF